MFQPVEQRYYFQIVVIGDSPKLNGKVILELADPNSSQPQFKTKDVILGSTITGPKTTVLQFWNTPVPIRSVTKAAFQHAHAIILVIDDPENIEQFQAFLQQPGGISVPMIVVGFHFQTKEFADKNMIDFLNINVADIPSVLKSLARKLMKIRGETSSRFGDIVKQLGSNGRQQDKTPSKPKTINLNLGLVFPEYDFKHGNDPEMSIMLGEPPFEQPIKSRRGSAKTLQAPVPTVTSPSEAVNLANSVRSSLLRFNAALYAADRGVPDTPTIAGSGSQSVGSSPQPSPGAVPTLPRRVSLLHEE